MELTQLLTANADVLAFTMVARASIEWQTGHNIAQILDAVL